MVMVMVMIMIMVIFCFRVIFYFRVLYLPEALFRLRLPVTLKQLKPDYGQFKFVNYQIHVHVGIRQIFRYLAVHILMKCSVVKVYNP